MAWSNGTEESARTPLSVLGEWYYLRTTNVTRPTVRGGTPEEVSNVDERLDDLLGARRRTAVRGGEQAS